MGKGEMRRDGFRCNGCGEWLHIDTSDTDMVLKVALWAYVLTPIILLAAGLSWRSVLGFTVGIPLTVALVGGFVRGWFGATLARGGVPHGKVSLRVTPSDDPPKKPPAGSDPGR
jgi:hypothetical protein